MKYCNSNNILHSYHVKRGHNLWNCKNVCVAETFEKLLLSVALSDVGVGLMVEPFFVSFFIKWLQLHNPDYIFYLGFVFVIGLFSITSFFNIMAISVDRLLAVQFHLRYQALGTRQRVVGVVIFIWTFSVFSTLTLFLVPYAVLTVIMSGIGTFCFLVTTAIYCKICFITRRHKRQIQQVRELEAQSRQNSEMRNLATIMKTAVGVLYVYFALLVSYFSLFILLAARVITGPNIVTTSFSLYTHTLMFFNSTLNPVIYG